ncbi:MAG: hypothetical protein HY811_08185 [Planctomycetes bacterium]|nr:hypothetical protein [Planctomycetota bacterium]
MKRIYWFYSVIPLMVLAGILFSSGIHFASGEEETIKPGEIHKKIACKESPNHSYACYLPKKYNPKEKYPILYCFAPDGNGLYFVEFYRTACEKAGWIVVASNDSKNGPMQTDAINAMFKDAQKRFSCDQDWICVSGFSGGSRVATMVAAGFKAKGHIAIGGIFSADNYNLPDMAYWLCCGETCFNRKEMEQAEEALKKKKIPVMLKVFPGTHQMPAKEVGEDAVKWLDDLRIKTIKGKTPCDCNKVESLPFCPACNKILMGYRCPDCKKLFFLDRDAKRKCPECNSKKIVPAELTVDGKCFSCQCEVKKESVCVKKVYYCPQHPDELYFKNTSPCPKCKKNLEVCDIVYSRVIIYYKCMKCDPEKELSEEKCPVCKKVLPKQKRCELSGSFPHINESEWGK